MGFDEKGSPELKYFDSYGDYIFGLGTYELTYDSLNSYLSIYNTKNKTLLKYDKYNSDMPDFYTTKSEYSLTFLDTVPQNITVDKDLNAWILTSETLMKFSPTGSEIYDLSYQGEKLHYILLNYDKNSNEILLTSFYVNMIYYFNIDSGKFDRIPISESGIKGKMKSVKKLIDNNIWLSDDLGYLYRYKGKGKFEVFDLKISNRENLGFPIIDFSIDYNRNLHLATEIGLLTNNSLLSDIKDDPKAISDEFSVSPNPARDYIIIQPSEGLEPSEGSDIQIFDMLGIIVSNSNCNPTPTLPASREGARIDVSFLAPGIYFIKIGNNVEKFVKIN
jgi:hypothetical protein